MSKSCARTQEVGHDYVRDMARGMPGDYCQNLKKIRDDARKKGDSKLSNDAKATYKQTAVGNSLTWWFTMGHIPTDAEWYLAELVMEITVSGAERNVVHRNLTLVRANSPDEAYEKAVQYGHKAETSYDNLSGQLVQIIFRGVAKLDVLLEDLYDGGELRFEEHIGVAREEIDSWIPPKGRLSVFVPPKPGEEHDPDYRSGAVARMAVERLSRLPEDKKDDAE